MQFSSEQPVFLQIKRWMREQVINGIQPMGSRIPSVRELSLQLGVNPSTVQRAYRELEDEGLFITRRGIGSFITDDPTFLSSLAELLAQEIALHYLEKMANIGFTPHASQDYLVNHLSELIAKVQIPSPIQLIGGHHDKD